ncbi:hypothetical protein H2O64_02605 [Kordia sp. YSTF-M3]|uniref:DUF1704 domain-containing protein n=1 Tax=Kordia aestuariivivens TaxID=2759037 RepID=A0ABR7Q4S6_9FLAO|nr:hypothetical protein [Kordia aestuariivivens]MBC8753545.1 hypothetical protein [Kordia aestuariivivens]
MEIKKTIHENQEEIVNTIKLLIYGEFPNLLKRIDFDDDAIYLDSLLFAYFNSKKDKPLPKELLEEILQGYFLEKTTIKTNYSYNKNNIAYIPKIGYFKKDQHSLYEPILEKDDFEIVKEVHPTHEKYFVVVEKGHIVNQNPTHHSVWNAHYEEVFVAIDIIREYLPKFYKELTFANKKIYLHDNSNILNFTSVETLGMLYFYVIGANNLIYFIEELIHQGSHNYLYYIVHKRKDFFKIDVDTIVMREYTEQVWDYRTIYGAFHGLFTVTQRLRNFDKLLSQNVFSGRNKHELLGRLTDQFSRFRTGLELLDQDTVFTKQGAAFYKLLDDTCEAILKKYNSLNYVFDLSNREVDFRYDDFCKLNSFDDFLKKEQKGFFKF